MNKDFVRVQALLRDLEHTVPSHVIPYIHLEYGRWWRSAFVWEESFPSKPAARRNAEQELAALYQQAEQKFHTCTDGRAPDGFLLRSKAEYDRRLSDLREVVGCCRTEATAPIVNRNCARPTHCPAWSITAGTSFMRETTLPKRKKASFGWSPRR